MFDQETEKNGWQPDPDGIHLLAFHHVPGSNQHTGIYAQFVTFSEPVLAHRHDFWELAFAIKGSGQHQDATSCLPLLSGDVWIIRPGQWHAYPLVRTSLSVFNLLFTSEFVAAHQTVFQSVHCLVKPPMVPEGIYHLRLSAQGLDQIQTLLTMLADEMRTPDAPGHASLCSGLLFQILGLLDRFMEETPQPERGEAARYDPGILNAVQYIEEHYADAVTLELIAQHSGYAPTHLARKFRRLLGISPIDYLLQVRLHHACTLLTATSLPVTAIAHQVGFTDSRYFATRFRSVLGITPSIFREQNAPQQ